MVWGSVENATGGDEVWLDRSFDNGASWSNGSRLGDTRTHSGHSPVGDAVVSTRRIALHVFNGDDMAWASLEGGGSRDRVWLDRSWDWGGFWSGGSMLGLAQVGRGGNSARTGMYNLNEPRFMLAGGVLRACGNASGGGTGCTAWARAAPSRTAAGATALAAFYLGNFAYGLWWQTAQGITALLNDALRSGSLDRVWIAGKTYDANVGKQLGNFTNGYIDDTGWWALTWLRAYDLTGQTRYRNTARADADLMWKTWDNTCGGGVWWSTQRTYKNAIANELMLEVNAALHNRLSGDVSYLERAQLGWRWFQSSGMINAEGLVNDGLNADCVNNGGTTWTYNQGVILGALTELSTAIGDPTLLLAARRIADAATSRLVTPSGVLKEPC